MDLNELATFERVVREGSFSAAARALGLGKATVSERVARLERRLGVRLLHRSARALALTEEGRRYHAGCRRMVEEAAQAEAALLAGAQEPEGLLRVTCPRLFGYAFLGTVVAEYLERYPRARVDLVLAERSVDLVEEGFDLALRIGSLPDSSLVLRRLGSAPMCFVASPAYLERRGSLERPEQLDAHRLIAVTRGGPVSWPVFEGGTARAIPVEGRFVVNSLVMARDAAMSGVGVAFLPAFLAAEALSRGLLAPVLQGCEPPPLGVNALYPSNRQLSVRVRAFLDLLLAHTLLVAPWEPAEALPSSTGGDRAFTAGAPSS